MSKRPDAIGSWSGPLDCINQDILHKQCLEQAGEFKKRSERPKERFSSYLIIEKLSSSGDSRSVEDLSQGMELIITFYCKSRNLRYAADCGFPELLLPFLSLSMPKADLFNCFYAMAAKYIPKSVQRFI